MGQHFAKGSCIAIGNKYRIIAKTMGSPGRPGHTAGDASFDRLGMTVRPIENKSANKMRPPMSLRVVNSVTACGKLVFGFAHG